MSALTMDRSGRSNRRGAVVLVLAGLLLATLLGVATGAVTATWDASPASAHATLQSTEPGAGSTVKQSPPSVTLHFDEQVEVSFGSVRVYNTQGSRVDEGNPSHPSGDSDAVRLALPRLVNGSYVVTWRVISADAHPVHGAFTFRVGTGQAADTRSLTHRLLAADGGDATVGALFATDRALAFASVLALIGGAAFLLVPWPEGRSNPRARRLLTIAWCTALVTSLLGIPLQGLYAGALPLSKIVSGSIVSSVLDTRFGKVWLARAILLVLLAALLRLVARQVNRSPAPLVVAAAEIGGVLLASSFGLASHPGTGSMVPLAVLADTSHVTAASLWVGGLLLLTVCVLGGRAPADAGTIVRRFSPIAFWAVVAIATSGVYQGWHEVGSIDALLHTTYGRLLVIKLLLFAVLIALARTSRNWVSRHNRQRTAQQTEPLPTPALVGAASPSTFDGSASGPGTDDVSAAEPPTWTGSPESLRTIRRSVAAEVAIAAVVLVVTSLLVNAQPGRTALAQPFSTEVTTKSLLIDVTVDPAKAGTTTVHMYTLSPEGAVKDVEELTAQMELPGKGIGPITVPLRRAGPGHFSAYGFDLPIAGHWKLTVKALTSDIDETEGSAMIHVR